MTAIPLVKTAAGNTYRLVTLPRDTFEGPGELCDLQVSPDGRYATVSLCATEGVIFDVFIVNLAQGTGFQIGICQPDREHGCRFKPTWFRGWFPDSRRVLLMSDWLEILDIETKESQRITPEGETVTDAAVSPDGKTIAYTTIKGDRLIFIDTTGRLLNPVPAPSPKPGARPEAIVWSPDGRFVAYIWDQTVIQFNSFGPLWVVDVRTGKQWQLGRIPEEATATPSRLAATSTASWPGAGPTAPRPTDQNPFGLMLPSPLVRSPGGIQVAKTLGAVYFRPASIFLDRWNRTCPECDIALNAGLKLVLTVRNSGPLPTSPPRDLAAYQRTLGAVLDKYHPVVLAVENEENSALFYTGTPADYGAQLKAACQVAHQRGIPCTNGGLVSTLVALLVYDHYLETGQSDRARDFAARAFSSEIRAQLGSPRARKQIDKGKALLQAYRAAGVDYVNFHWYIADTRALGEAVAYLRAQTGLPVITNEIGQFTDNHNQTTAVMAKIVELGLPIAVWFGLDGPQARGLVNLDGSLRPTGEAFKRFIERNFRAILGVMPRRRNPCRTLAAL